LGGREARRRSCASSANLPPVSIEDLIEEGESDELEFKSSLRWDVCDGCVNKKLEEVIIKTVAAFTNSDGGTLLIGVDDDGNVLGLENDYAALGNADKDKFELHWYWAAPLALGTGTTLQAS